ncbi:MAG: hypothetical protein DWH79_11120 [Planctomycetota bacterium]|nr:MAG: hypothetical protein DWH79_11120 [Planctomycetota bacterium]
MNRPPNSPAHATIVFRATAWANGPRLSRSSAARVSADRGAPVWLFAVRVLLTVIVVVGLLAASDAFGCPTCKDGIADGDPEGVSLARGYFYSILIMLAMPFTLAGSFGAYVWREMRRQRLQSPESLTGRADDLPGTES